MASIKLSIGRLTTGLYIKLPLSWSEHPFLLNHFKIKDQQQIRIIQSLGLKYVYLLPEKSDTAPLAPDTPLEGINQQEQEFLDERSDILWKNKEKRIRLLKDYKHRLQRCEKDFERSIAQLRASMSKIKQRPVTAILEAESLVSDLVDSLFSSEQFALHLMGSEQPAEGIYYHSMNVAIIAMLLAKRNNFSQEEVKKITLGALFHDMGKLKVPSAIIRKATPLTEPELNYLKQHPKYGIELANLNQDFPESAKTIIAQHHELLDGSGYPNQMKGESIDPMAQLVAVVDAYDSLCHPNDPAKARIPYSALSYLYKNKQHQYNPRFLTQLVRLMGIYPPGSVIELSNQQLGLVISVNSDSLLKPNVLLYDPSVPSNEAPIIDLQDSELKILHAVAPNKLPQAVYDYLNPRVRISLFLEAID